MAEVVGIQVPDLPPSYVALETVAVVKCLDDEGDPTILIRSSNGLMAWEAVGMLMAAGDLARGDLQTDLMGIGWEDQDEENTEGLGERD